MDAPFPLSAAHLTCSWHLSPDDPPAIKELVDDFNGITLLEGQLILFHSSVAFLDHICFTCTQNGDGGSCADTSGMGTQPPQPLRRGGTRALGGTLHCRQDSGCFRFGFRLPLVLSSPMVHPGPFTISPEESFWVQAEEAHLSLLKSVFRIWVVK